MPSPELTPRTTAAERRSLVALAIVALIPFVLLAVWAHLSPAPAWEQDIVNRLLLGRNLAGDVITTVNTIGNLESWTVVVAVLAVLVGLLRGIRAGVLVGLTLAVDLLATLSKALVERGRPDTVAAHLLYGADSYGYPSGHAARAAALAGALIWVFVPVRWRLPAAAAGAVIGGLAMGYARVSLGVHFPSDTIGGMLLGVAWLAATAAFV
jgi:membrane-associated phospholipid phosphatase